MSREFKNGAVGKKWVRVRWESFLGGLVLVRPRKWVSLWVAFGQTDLEHKTGLEHLQTVRRWSLWNLVHNVFFHLPHYLSGYVLEHQVKHTSLERADP